MASSFAKYGMVMVTLGLILMVYIYSFSSQDTRFLPSPIISLIRNASSSITKDRFFVKRYNLDDDSLSIQGYFKQTNGESQPETIHIEGISNLVNQMKPFILKDEKFERATLDHEHFFKTDNRKVKDVSCIDIFKGSEVEMERAINITKTRPKPIVQPQDYINMTQNCSRFIQSRGYITDPLTAFERDFPIAFTLLMFKDVEQSERLLRAIYRPQHLICVHVDNKSSPEVYSAMESITNCFDNVFMISKRFDVRWGTITVLEPELQCMEELWNKNKTWKYFINLTGQEFPLRTNYELVRILTAYNGANDIEGTIKR